MKKLLLFICILCLAVPAAYSQDIYQLDKVIVTARNYESKAPVFEKSLNDSVQIVTAEWDFPIIPIFKSLVLENGAITSVVVLTDGHSYKLDSEDNTLKFSEPQLKEEETDKSLREDISATISASDFELYPYAIQKSDNRLTITFDGIVYGSSNYPGQTLQGKCQMVYVKL